MSEYSTGDVREHDDEPLVGLPECLPKGERLLWQGSPDAWAFARRVLHFNKILVWFVVIMAWRMVSQWDVSGSLALDILYTPTLALVIALATVWALAWLYARSTVYTLTSRRVTMRFGLAVQITMNIPFSKMLSADVRDHGKDIGNIAFQIEPGARMSHVVLWPNVRPWRWVSPQPMLCCVPDLAKASVVLTNAVSEFASTRAADTASAVETNRSVSDGYDQGLQALNG